MSWQVRQMVAIPSKLCFKSEISSAKGPLADGGAFIGFRLHFLWHAQLIKKKKEKPKYYAENKWIY